MSNIHKNNDNSILSAVIEKGVEKLMDFEKSEVLRTVNHAIETGNVIMDNLDQKYHVDPITVEQYLTQISPKIDEEIIKHYQSSQFQPLGGEMKLGKDTQSKHVLVVWDFYFVDVDKKMHKIGSQKVMDKEFFTQESYARILQGLVFDIHPPKR